MEHFAKKWPKTSRVRAKEAMNPQNPMQINDIRLFRRVFEENKALKAPQRAHSKRFWPKMETLSQQKHTGLANTREPQGKLGALTLFAPHLDRATMAQRAVLDDGEAKTGAASFL